MVRAKFMCVDKRQCDGGVHVKLNAVTYTPSGQLSMGTINPIAAEQFKVGKEYFVDFTPSS